MRLIEPSGTLSGSVVKRLENKLVKIMGLLASSPAYAGGNPYLYSILSCKTHVLNVSEEFKTAATDGNVVFWCPRFLDSLSMIQALAIEKHEGWHAGLFHPMLMYAVEYPNAFNIAADFIVNSLIEKEWWEFKGYSAKSKDGPHPIWSAPLGEPITLAELKEVFKGDHDKIMQDLSASVKRAKARVKEAEAKANRHGDDDDDDDDDDDIEKKEEKGIVEIDQFGKQVEERKFKIKYSLVDESLLQDRSVMSVYKEIKEWYKDLNDRMKKLLDDNFLADEHIQGDNSSGARERAVEDMLRSYKFAKGLRGNIPSQLESILEELTDPILDLSQFLDQSIKKSKRDGGTRADYTQFKRRFIGEGVYYPRYKKALSQILVLLDTSGSMSNKEIAEGVSQLKQFIGLAEIYVVPVDAEPHWNAVARVTEVSEFKAIKVVGRGGTVFDDFFRNYRRELRRFGHFGSIIVITDGGVGIIPKDLTPQCDVGWILTQETQFSQHFGKPIYLTRSS